MIMDETWYSISYKRDTSSDAALAEACAETGSPWFSGHFPSKKYPQTYRCKDGQWDSTVDSGIPTIEDHRRIIQAFKRRDYEAVDGTIRSHILKGKELLLRIVSSVSEGRTL